MSMPPFLRNKNRGPGIVIQATRTPDTNPGAPQEPSEDQGLESAAAAMIQAFDTKDAKSLAKALQDAFTILQNQPEDQEAEPMPGDEDNG